MSPIDIIEKFVGNFHSIEERVNKHPEKAHYYPGPGVRLRLDLIELEGTKGQAYAKIKIDRSGPAFDATESLETAVFQVEDNNTLVARNIEVNPGLLLEERLTMGPEGMTHKLTFSDGKLGSWICVP